jgi:hypothetical protein
MSRVSMSHGPPRHAVIKAREPQTPGHAARQDNRLERVPQDDDDQYQTRDGDKNTHLKDYSRAAAATNAFFLNYFVRPS